jgi:hypothetical protein
MEYVLAFCFHLFLDPLLRRLRDAAKPSIGRAKGTFAAYADEVALRATAHEAALARGSIAAMLGVATAWLGGREVAVSERPSAWATPATSVGAALLFAENGDEIASFSADHPRNKDGRLTAALRSV